MLQTTAVFYPLALFHVKHTISSTEIKQPLTNQDFRTCTVQYTTEESGM